MVEVICLVGPGSLAREMVLRGHHRYRAAAHHGAFWEVRQYLLRLVEVRAEEVRRIEIGVLLAHLRLEVADRYVCRQMHSRPKVFGLQIAEVSANGQPVLDNPTHFYTT